MLDALLCNQELTRSPGPPEAGGDDDNDGNNDNNAAEQADGNHAPKETAKVQVDGQRRRDTEPSA